MMSGSDGQQALRTAFKAVEQRMRLDWSGKGVISSTSLKCTIRVVHGDRGLQSAQPTLLLIGQARRTQT